MGVNVDHVSCCLSTSSEDIPHQFFDSIKARGVVWKERKVADIGSGIGALTRKLHKRGADVIGVEPDSVFIDTAKATESKQYLEIPYLVGTAELTNLPDHDYDIAIVHNSWQLFDRPKATVEMQRILKDKGSLIVCDSKFIPHHEIVQNTTEFLNAHLDNKMTDSKENTVKQVNGFPLEWLLEWQEAGFDVKDFYKFYYEVDYSLQSWCERVGELPWILQLDSRVKEEVMNSLFTYLSQRYDSRYEFTLKHQFTVCLMKK
ncbi:class I SAM-dependent methyltransferase [Rossellomorea aquimaris]|uniref:class I SAM-dependent methyltransferase n=1 Tax=Rossellomorea aquimaris TaxID=189382 RepID=UPI0007D04434|nr:class I SAM-dependent methyltransferase [Rossellomorea aquimaris]